MDNSIDRVPADYKAYGKAKDKVDPHSLTYSNLENVGAFEKHMHQKPDPRCDLVELDEPEGCVFEADRGVPLLILITKLQSEKLKVGPCYPNKPSP